MTAKEMLNRHQFFSTDKQYVLAILIPIFFPLGIGLATYQKDLDIPKVECYV